MNSKLDPQLKTNLRRSSHRTAVISAFGAVLVFSAILYAAFELHTSNTTAVAQKAQADTSSRLAAQYKAEADSLAQALSYTTDAVNALRKHDYAQAVSNYDLALTFRPNDPDILNLKGYALFKMHRYDDAAAVLNESIRLDPDNPWSELNLAKVQCVNHKYAEAKTAIGSIITNFPDFIDTILGDGEFTRVCRPIMKWVRSAISKTEQDNSSGG